MREPTLTDLTEYVCSIQPELDERAARNLLHLDPDVFGWIAHYWLQQRIIADSLLNLHLEIMEMSA